VIGVSGQRPFSAETGAFLGKKVQELLSTI